MNRKAVIYTRVSTDEQRESGFSLQDQEKRLRAYSEKAGWEIIAHYQDDHSAKNFNRPDFQRMLNDLKTGKIKATVFLCVRMDRFSRNVAESLSMIQLLGKYGLEFRTLDQNYDLEAPENWIPYILNMVLPQVENERRGLNTKRGMRQARRNGFWNGKIPKGYSWEQRNGKSYLVPNEDADLIKYAFEELAKGIYSIEEVRKKVHKKGLYFSPNGFHKMIRNVVYMGKIRIEAWKDEPEEIVNGMHEPLVSQEFFNTVQKVISGRKKTMNPKSQLNENLPLRGFLICRQCGGKLTGSASTSKTGTRHFYYHCQHGCPERFRADQANIQFIQYLNQFQIPPEIMNLYYHIVEDVFKKDEVDKKRELARIDKQIQEFQNLIENVEDKFFKDQIEASTYSKAKSRYESEINRFKDERARLLSVSSEFMNYIDYGFSLLYNLDGYYNEARVDVKQKILSSIFHEKLTFDGKTYRTLKRNEVFELLTSNINNLGAIKQQKVVKIDNLSPLAPPRGFEPLLQDRKSCVLTPRRWGRVAFYSVGE